MRKVACALVHYPVLDRGGAIVTSAITNIDLHDIARSSHTFGLSAFYVVHPVTAQRVLAERIQGHWVDGSGGRRIPDRTPALSGMRIVASLEDAATDLAASAGEPGGTSAVELWTTAARAEGSQTLSFGDARRSLSGEGPPVLLTFGTGWGLAADVHRRAAFRLEPIQSPRADGYNHLSVRAAAAILFDRLLGRN
jgi:hypothetical protein